MKEVLYVDCCIRGENSRTRQVAQAFLEGLSPDIFHVTPLVLAEEPLLPLTGDYFSARQAILDRGELNHPRFRYAHQFAGADLVVMAAPFWDLSFPALLKIYIENVSVEGITFACSEDGLRGICKGSHLIFLTTRGGHYENSPLEQGSRYLEALKDFFGFGAYACVAADGLDAVSDPETVLTKACQKARTLAETILSIRPN